MTLKSTQFIGSARCPELNSNPSVSSNENAFTSYFCIHNEPMTFDLDLMTPKSNQFIGFASNIPDLSLAGIHQSVLQITRSRERDVTDGRTTRKHNASGYFVTEGIKSLNYSLKITCQGLNAGDCLKTGNPVRY